MALQTLTDRTHRGRTPHRGDALQLSQTVVPMPTTSMRALEFAIAVAALGVAILLGLVR
jgi:hypothetical protein